MKISLTPDLHINQFSGATITELESGITNGMVDKKGESLYLTQRPSVDIFEDAGTFIADTKGRGIFYWEATDALYMVNNGTLYKDSQSNVLSTALTSGVRKCTFQVLDDTLILIDPENNQAFTITSGDTVTEITDTDFPSKQIPAIGLADGGVSLDGYLFVMGEDGVIYNSDNGAPSSWSALGYVGTDREPDAGVYLGTHHDNLAALGASSIEFFYNASNPVGSSLARRQDVAYNIGCSSGESVWEEGDRMFFVGVNYSGALGVYTLENFQVRKVSSSTIDSFLTQAIVKDGFSTVGCGLSAGGHIFYLLTICSTPDSKSAHITLVFDDSTGLWGEWDLDVNDLDKFPLIAWTKRGGSIERPGEGILINGDMLTLNDDLNPQDTLLGSNYIEDGYIEAGYYESADENGTPIVLKARTGMMGGGNQYKFPKSVRHISDQTESAQNLTVRWASERNSFNTGRTLDMSNNNKLTRLGRFIRRNHEIEYSGTEPVRLEALEID